MKKTKSEEGERAERECAEAENAGCKRAEGESKEGGCAESKSKKAKVQ